VTCRLIKADTIRQTIAEGVSQGLIGYAREGADGRLTLEAFEQKRIAEQSVEILDDVLLIKSDDARRLLEPPRLDALRIEPGSVSVLPCERVSFRCTAIDQYGQPFPVPPINWDAEGGAITADGVLTAGDTAGNFHVQARSGTLEATAQVRIAAKSGRGDDGRRTGERLLRWSGRFLLRSG
jgi:hypothetical protein